METKTIDGCCEYEGQVLPSKRHPFGIPCNHSCHSKAPVNTPVGIGARAPKTSEKYLLAQNHHENCRRVNCHCPDIEAPTDADWKETLMDEFAVTFERAQDDTVVERLESFIASQIQKEREKAYIKGCNDKENNDKFMHRGKFEAFSLVRKSLKEMQLLSTMPVKSIPRIEYEDGYNQALTDLLSTLEGK